MRSTTLELDKSKILEQLTSLNEVAKNNDWGFEYDSDLDQLIFGKEVMPDDSFLYNINDEINLFVSADSTIHGLFIEYFKDNYIEHNQVLKPVVNILKEEEDNKTPTETPETVILAKKALEDELLIDALKSLMEKDKLVTAV